MPQIYKNNNPLLVKSSDVQGITLDAYVELTNEQKSNGTVYYVTDTHQIKFNDEDYGGSGDSHLTVTTAQYTELLAGNTINIDNIEYTYNPNTIYFVSDYHEPTSNNVRIGFLTQVQYDELVSNGSITVDGESITYDINTIYFVN